MQQIHIFPVLRNLVLFCVDEKTSFLKSSLEQEKLIIIGWKAFVGNFFPYFICMILFMVFLGVILRPFVMVTSVFVMNNLGVDLLAMIVEAIRIILLVFLFCFTPKGRTRWGSTILADIQRKHDTYDVMQRFALNGYTALSGGDLDDLRQIFSAEEKEKESTAGCGCGC